MEMIFTKNVGNKWGKDTYPRNHTNSYISLPHTLHSMIPLKNIILILRSNINIIFLIILIYINIILIYINIILMYNMEERK